MGTVFKTIPEAVLSQCTLFGGSCSVCTTGRISKTLSVNPSIEAGPSGHGLALQKAV